MNSGTKDGRGRRQRPAALTLALVGAALLVAACGGVSAAGGPGTPQSPYQQALAYAQCMRAHGDPGFPDPNSQGLFPHPAGPQHQSASRTCGHLLPGRPVTAAQKQQHVGQALKFAGCMRSHGVPSFPDPSVAQGGAAVGFRMSGVDQNSPQFQAAVQACRKFEPAMAGLMTGGGAP